MREVVLDTETTGLDPDDGHRIVEIGALELVNHIATKRMFHVYINPERPMTPEAEAVHGLGDKFLADKPVFAAIAEEFLAFIGDDRLVIHNAAFDMKFLNSELALLGHKPMPMERALDTIALAKTVVPAGSKLSLDALCRRFDVDNSGRELHGALLDSELLAEVYLELRGGRQPDFGLSATRGHGGAVEKAYAPPPRPRRLAPRLTAEEAAAHEAFVAQLADGGRWTA